MIYLFTTVVAVSLGLMLVNVVQPGESISEETRTELVANYSQSTEKYKEEAAHQKDSGPLRALEDLVPDNIIGASGENKNMLQVIFFAIFFGVGLILLPEEKAKPVKDTERRRQMDAFRTEYNKYVLEEDPSGKILIEAFGRQTADRLYDYCVYI